MKSKPLSPKKRKDSPTAAPLPPSKRKAVHFQEFSGTSPEKNNVEALLQQLSPKQLQVAAAGLRVMVEEDRAARAKLFGLKDDDLEDDRKMPAQADKQAAQADEDGVSLLEDDDKGHGYEHPDAYFAREDAAHLTKTQEEVRQFMEKDNVPLQPTLLHARQDEYEQEVLLGLLDDDYNNDRVINAKPNRNLRRSFRAYCEEAKDYYMGDLTKGQKGAIRLLDVLKRKKAPLDTYGEVMEWHYREKGELENNRSLKDVHGYISRDVIMDTIKHRYNMHDKFPTSVKLLLPVSHATVKIVKHDAWDCFESLLTDPRVKDADYNFVDHDPFAPPKKQGPIGDFPTARAHRVAYEKYITDPTKQVLMPVIMYIDGACTGQFQNLPITALKMTLGIYTRNYRKNEHAWRTLGYVASVSKANSRGKAIFTESEHMDAKLQDLEEDEGLKSSSTKENQAQDFHSMLEEILKSYLDVQTNGFLWDL
jgi:hypothetical protein